MNKSDLIAAVAEKSSLTKLEAGRAVDAIIAVIGGSLKAANPVTLPGFGTFAVKERKERTGRNPKTGETIQIKAATTPSFKAAKGLKDAIA